MSGDRNLNLFHFFFGEGELSHRKHGKQPTKDRESAIDARGDKTHRHRAGVASHRNLAAGIADDTNHQRSKERGNRRDHFIDEGIDRGNRGGHVVARTVKLIVNNVHTHSPRCRGNNHLQGVVPQHEKEEQDKGEAEMCSRSLRNEDDEDRE